MPFFVSTPDEVATYCLFQPFDTLNHAVLGVMEQLRLSPKIDAILSVADAQTQQKQ